MIRNPLAPSRPEIWAVEDTSIQVTWGDLPAGRVDAQVVGGPSAGVDHGGGPGSIEIDGLAPATTFAIELVHAGGRIRLRGSTLAPPPGRLLCRIATVSDLHLGSTRWGAAKTMVDRTGDGVGFALRCARAALAEAAAWGADLLIVKGDAAHHQDEAHFELLGQLLDDIDELPVVLLPGNHDVDGRTAAALPAKVGERGIPYVSDATAEDLPGIRIIAADTTVPGKGRGSVDRIASQVVELATEATTPYLLALHHQLQPYRMPTFYPIGIPAPGSTGLLDRLVATNPNGLVTSGHTHRNRTRRHGPLVATEVGSTRDWPGVWAGYAVHEGGVRQVVRRAAAPGAISWHEYSRRALFGVWGQWAAGRLDDRCFTHPWPTP